MPPKTPPAGDPHAEYTSRLAERQARAARHARRESIAGNGRVVVFLLGAILTWLVFGAGLLEPWWLAAPVVGFVAATVSFDRATRARARAERAAGHYERGLARLDGRWPGTGEPGTRFLDDHHAYAADLDIFGKGSLFERLCRARTRGGEDVLADWLRGPAAPGEVRARQAAIDELCARIDLRENLDLLGADFRAVADPEGLAAWATAPPVLGPGALRLTAFLLAALAVGSLASWAILGVGRTVFLVTITGEFAFALWLRGRVNRILSAVDQRARDLALLAQVLALLERERFATPRLGELRSCLDSAGQPPSARVALLGRLLERLEWRRNQAFAPVAALLLWGTQHAFALEAWRAASGSAVARWLATVSQLEALGSLACYAYENPGDPFPDVVAGGPLFDGDGLAHPLLPPARAVRNAVHLGDPLRVLFVSGSNMSGKSTLLRTVGVNTVLALAGAPVRAARLRVSPLAVGATLRIQDSLQAGQSRFYAEITRVRQLVKLAGAGPPLLFLLDELFQGTNSHDRRLGAEAVVASLVEAGALGLVTTHDLALTHIALRVGPRGANVHFEDHFENGSMTFDYCMRPGVVRKSNALALMRAVGLEVPRDQGGAADD
jgi:hypothetical protein